MQLNLLKNDIFLKTWKLAKAINQSIMLLQVVQYLGNPGYQVASQGHGTLTALLVATNSCSDISDSFTAIM